MRGVGSGYFISFTFAHLPLSFSPSTPSKHHAPSSVPFHIPANLYLAVLLSYTPSSWLPPQNLVVRAQTPIRAPNSLDSSQLSVFTHCPRPLLPYTKQKVDWGTGLSCCTRGGRRWCSRGCGSRARWSSLLLTF